jgi:hypothetical protein
MKLKKFHKIATKIEKQRHKKKNLKREIKNVKVFSFFPLQCAITSHEKKTQLLYVEAIKKLI